MNSWKLALVGLATFSASSFAAPVTTGSAAAVKSSIKIVSVPDLGGDEVVVVENKVTGEISVQGPNGELVATTEVGSAQKACYDCGPVGPGYVYGGGQLGYGYPVAPPTIVEEDETIIRRRFRSSTLPPPVPAYGYGPGPGYDVGPGYDDGY